jgi:hypothetical protein
MDWSLAISRNRDALAEVVAAIVTLLGGSEGGTIRRHLRNAALALLRPAEAAARRLIVIAARGLAPAPAQARGFAPIAAGAAAAGARPPAFRLFDRPKHFRRRSAIVPAGEPRIRTFWSPPQAPFAPPPPAPPPSPRRPDPDALVDAARLRLRLAALEGALSDLPRQARRLARWRARWEARRAARPALPPRSPLRIGRPPGWRADAAREVDCVLRECHALACDALRADTS